VTNNDRQIGARFTNDDSAVSTPGRGATSTTTSMWSRRWRHTQEPDNTADLSETVDEFSPDGKLLAIGVKQKTTPQPISP